MSTGQAKEDNLIQLNTNENNTDHIRLNNKVNNLEKTINEVETHTKQSTQALRAQLNDLTNKDSDLENRVKKTLKKIDHVETEINQLHKDIDTTNNTISHNIKKIETEHSDLSSKVSETYKQLGSVEKSYSALKTKSGKITKDIKNITQHVETISDEIRQQILNIEEQTKNVATDIKQIDATSQKATRQLTAGQEELIEKTNSIVADANKTAKALKKSIQENAALMASIETRLIAEIETLATTTEATTNKLNNNIEKANDEINSQNAKMLKLQSVDEALEKRAVALEETAQSLATETRLLQAATNKLDNRSSALEDSVETLGIKIYRIEEENKIQQAQLDILRDKTSKTNQTLAALSRLVSINFVTTGAFLTLLIISVISLYTYQNNQWSQESITTAQRTELINQKINGLSKQVNNNEDLATDRITQLETQVASLNQQLKTVNDKNTSLDNRLINIAPHRKIGNDNILHSQQWINQQPVNHYAIKILTAHSEAELFELAVRYNYNLTDVLSYKTENNAGRLNYILFMGNYADQAQANTALEKLPFRLNGQKPTLTTFEKMI